MDNRTASMAIVGGALLVVLIAAGQDSLLGTRQEWKLTGGTSPGMVHFIVESWKPGSHWSNGTDVRFDDFRGLSRDTLEHGGPARFEYVQDAGRLVCQGDFSRGRGSGSFRFEPDPKFPAELKALGYDTPDDEQQFSMLLTGVSLEFARGTRDAGLHASTRQLVELRIHGVSLDYIRDAGQAGYQNLSAQDFIDLRIHGVTTGFLRDLKSHGYNLYPRDIVELRIHGVTGDFIADLKAAGYDLSSSQIVDLGIHGVNSAYLRDLKNYGLQPHASDLVQLKIHGVSTDYLKGLKDAGYSGLFASEITDLAIHGVSVDFIRDAKDLGYSFTPRQLIDLRTHGVDGAYLRHLRDTGLQNLSAAQIEKLKIHGVD